MMTIGWEATRATAVTLIPCINRNSQWPSSFLKRKPRQCLGQLHQRPSVAVSNNHNKGINLNFVGNIGKKEEKKLHWNWAITVISSRTRTPTHSDLWTICTHGPWQQGKEKIGFNFDSIDENDDDDIEEHDCRNSNCGDQSGVGDIDDGFAISSRRFVGLMATPQL